MLLQVLGVQFTTARALLASPGDISPDALNSAIEADCNK